jgi:hypothetical protein
VRASADPCAREDQVQRRKRGSSRKRGNGKFKPITIAETCELLHCSDRHYQRIKGHLDIRRLGRKILVNELSVMRYIKSLPSA